jgi:glycosyltransferase involved in cell wall biosynthesis
VKILLVAHNFPRRDGDIAGSFLLALSQGLVQRGHEVVAVVPHDANLPEKGEVGGIQVHRFRYGRDDAETLAYRGTMADQVLRSWGARWRLMRFLRSMRSAAKGAMRAWNPDVIHVHWWFPGAIALHGLSRRGAATVITSHGTDLFLVDRVRAARAVAARVFAAAERVTVISSPLVGRVTSLGVDGARIAVIPMPVDRALVADDATGHPVAPERNRNSTGPARLLFAGRLVERKGAEYAIRALRLLLDKGIDATLDIVGDGPLRLDLDALCDELQLGTRVHFTGMVPPADVTAAMRQADLLLMPAVTDWKGEQEGFGMVIVEAMFSGTPVIASASGGITDIIRNNENGILVAERDAGAIADACAILLTDTTLYNSIAAAALQSATAEYHPDAIARRFENVYLDAVAERR